MVTAMERQFEQYLIDRGYRTITPSGRPSTVPDYIGRIHTVCQWEGCSWEELAARIDGIAALYDTGGPKEGLGSRSHRSVINALKRFREFVAARQS